MAVDLLSSDHLVAASRRRGRHRAAQGRAAAALVIVVLAPLGLRAGSAEATAQRVDAASRLSGTIFFTRTARSSMTNEYADIYAVTPASGRVRRFASSRRVFEFDPNPSPAGDRLAFSRNGGLALTSTAGGPLRMIDPDGYQPAWAADGQRIAYRHELGQRGIHVYDLQRRTQRRLTRGALDALPNFSPDGLLIATLSDVPAPDSPIRLRLINAHTGRTVRTVTRQAIGELKWSPDGTRTLFATPRGLFVADEIARNARKIVSGLVIEYAWAPNGSTIAFTRGQTADNLFPTRIWVIGLDGTGRRRLSSGDADGSPAWSPDSEWIAYVGSLGELRVMRSDGSDSRVIARKDVAEPAWSTR
jgi:Tol biopolymer transport system component